MKMNVSFDRLAAEVQFRRQRAVRKALGHQAEHGALALGELVEWVVGALLVDEPSDELGVDHAVTIGDAPHVGGEAVEVRDAILEQITDACLELADQPHRVMGLDVL